MPLAIPSAEMRVHIRDFQPEDAPSVEFVVLSVFQEWGFLPSIRDRQELETLRFRNPFDAFFVAEDPNLGIVGCAGIDRLDDSTCELRKIYLLRRFRGRTIGKQLLETCISEARNRCYSRIKIELSSSMTQYLSFYHRNGFILAETEKPDDPSVEYVYYKAL